MSSPGHLRRSYAVSCWLYLRLLGVCYLVAFWSLGVQVLGLIGQDGILPAREVMDAAQQWAAVGHVGLLRFLEVPTLCWLGVSDAWLVGLCIAGAVLSVPLIAGIGAPVVLPLLWLLYLSLSTVTREFLSFQWDALLLESGLLAIALAPWTLFHRPRDHEPPALARWLIWWLVFRLMFTAGLVKLTSGDPLWRDLSALAHHYETQPLPSPAGWYAHHLPIVAHRASTAVMFAVELALPWLIFVGATGRRAAAGSFIVLMLVIAVTGNFAFFNLLTIALACTLVDTRRAGPAAAPRRLAWVPAAVLACLTLPVTIDVLAGQAGLRVPGGEALHAWRQTLRPLRSANAYGLFAVMSTNRPELTVEGSRDGRTWVPYVFKYKPGDVRRPPRWVAPHQPRLDWHMWFAALDSFEGSEWLERFCRRLLEGSPAVTGLLDVNPFPDAPPAFVRVMRSEYHIPPLAQARREQIWWTASQPEPYSGVLQK